MKNPIRMLAIVLALALAIMPSFSAAAGSLTPGRSMAQQSVGALERGYRTGYSDGYQAGYRDSVERAARDYSNKEEYQRADRAYASSYGTLEDYRDGYQQGFEIGYGAGFERRRFDSTIPTNISRRGATPPQQQPQTTPQTSTGGVSDSMPKGTSATGTSSAVNISSIPAGTMMRVELLTNLSTDATQRGDRFQARVIEPAEYSGAMIQGHVTRVKRPGKLKGNAELQLSFDQISANNRWTEFEAQVVEVIDAGDDDNVGDVDEEGGVKGKDRTKDDVARVGASTGVGAILGAILGGGKGAAIGAAIGGAVGTGGVLMTRGRDIRLDNGQHLRIRTSREARF